MNMLECIGVCQVMNNKETDTNVIQINLPKEFPSQDGENVAVAEEQPYSHYSSAGNKQSGKVLMGNTAPATWMPLNTNRITAPDVRIGSEVVVYQFKNSNRYYWTLYGLNGSMRLETIVYAISASPNIDENTPISSDNYYIFTVSSHKKKIEFLSGRGNGEALGFQMTLDLENGWFGSMDSDGNIFCINGVERSMTYLNKDKTQFSVDKKDVTINNLGDTLINTKENFTVKSKNITLLAEDNFIIRGGKGEISINEGLTQKVGGKHTMDIGNGLDITTGKVTMSQDLTVESNIRANAKVSAPTVAADSSLTVSGKEVKGHVHPRNKYGDPTTGAF